MEEKNNSIWGQRRGLTIGLFPWLGSDAEVKKWAYNSVFQWRASTCTFGPQ